MKVPIECTARYNFISEQARKLALTFENGNRRDFLDGLGEFPRHVSYAVLAVIMYSDPDLCSSIKRYLHEIA